MTRELLVSSSVTPNRIAIVQDNEYRISKNNEPSPHLLAVTGCCMSQVYYRMGKGGGLEEAYCSECGIRVKTSFWRGNRSSYFYADSDARVIQSWVCEWTGLDPRDVEIGVTK